MRISKNILIEGKYLNFPVKRKADLRIINFSINSKKVAEFDIEYAKGKPDYWVFCDVSQYKGCSLCVEIDGINSDCNHSR